MLDAFDGKFTPMNEKDNSDYFSVRLDSVNTAKVEYRNADKIVQSVIPIKPKYDNSAIEGELLDGICKIALRFSYVANRNIYVLNAMSDGCEKKCGTVGKFGSTGCMGNYVKQGATQ